MHPPFSPLDSTAISTRRPYRSPRGETRWTASLASIIWPPRASAKLRSSRSTRRAHIWQTGRNRYTIIIFPAVFANLVIKTRKFFSRVNISALDAQSISARPDNFARGALLQSWRNKYSTEYKLWRRFLHQGLRAWNNCLAALRGSH